MSKLYSHAIAAKLILGAIATAIALSGCTASRFLSECARGSLSCQ